MTYATNYAMLFAPLVKPSRGRREARCDYLRVAPTSPKSAWTATGCLPESRSTPRCALGSRVFAAIGSGCRRDGSRALSRRASGRGFVKFKLDENLSFRAVEPLEQAGHDRVGIMPSPVCAASPWGAGGIWSLRIGTRPPFSPWRRPVPAPARPREATEAPLRRDNGCHPPTPEPVWC